MKFVNVTGTSAVFLFVGTMIPMYAQRGGQGDDQPDRQRNSDRLQGRQHEGALQQQTAKPMDPGLLLEQK